MADSNLTKPNLNSETQAHTLRRIALAGLVILLVCLIWTTGRTGFATLLYTFAARANQAEAAGAAVTLSPRDAQAHYIRGAALEFSGDAHAALAEYTQAVVLRPRDYVLWLALAQARELTGDLPAAIAAANEAVARAPFYAPAHWQLGNLLIRAGRHDGGFSELRLASESDPTLLPAVIDLAGHLASDRPEYILAALQPHSPEAYLALFTYFRKQGNLRQASAMLRAAGTAGEAERRTFIEALIVAKQFREAYALWGKGPVPDPDGPEGPLLNDPSFEDESDLNEPGFGWHAPNKTQSFSLLLDGVSPREGKWSAAFEFKGEPEPNQAILSQLVLLEPHTRYQLQFSVRTATLVSGGLPFLNVVDAMTQQTLAQSETFPQDRSEWLDYSLEFTTAGSSEAVQIAVRRQPCSKTPCPIFGRLWLDKFSLQRL
jgi:hypothetical protein